MLGFLFDFRLPHLNLPLSNSGMHLSPEELSIGSQGPLQALTAGGMVESKEVRVSRWRTTENQEERQKAKIDSQKVEILKLKGLREWYTKKYKRAKGRIAELEGEVEEASKAHQEALEKRDRHIQEMTDRLTRTEELLAVKSAELTVAQSFLSTTDHLSEAEVLGIVRDLNENVFQVAANLAEEWEKLGSSRAGRSTISQDEVDVFSQFYGPALIQSVLNRDSAAVSFLVQSCLCYVATEITSSWDRDQQPAILGPLYQRLSTSEGQGIAARWRSLTYSYLSRPPPPSSSIVKHVADVLWFTGSFSSHRRSVEFTNDVALAGIETIKQLALRLESVFMVEVSSSDMYLRVGTPRALFDETRMTNEFESDEASTPGRRDKVAGTTEVGVEKSVYVGRGKDRRTEILLKPKVVLEKDVSSS